MINRIFLIIFCLSGTVFAQSDLIVLKTDAEKQAAVDAEQRRIDRANTWKPVTQSKEGPGFTLWFYQKARVISGGDVEAWLKVVPVKPRQDEQRRYPRNTSYLMQLFTFHCSDDRFSVEGTTYYDRSGDLLLIEPEYLRTYRKAVVPGTVIDQIQQFFCGE